MAEQDYYQQDQRWTPDLQQSADQMEAWRQSGGREATQTPTTNPNPAPKTGGWLSGSAGFDQTKLNDPNKTTEKYQIGRVFDQYDPSLGLNQPGLLDALNALNIGDFYAENGDRLGVRNSRNGSRLVDGVGDVIGNFTGAGAKTWNPLMTGDGGEGGSAPNTGGSTMQQMLYPQSAPAAPTTSAPRSKLDPSINIIQRGGAGDPFASMPGGGVKLSNGAWVPSNHPLAEEAAANPGSLEGDEVRTEVPAATPAAPAADGLPANNKDALLQLLRQRMAQDLNIDPNDPVIAKQVESYGAAQDRSRQQYLDETAERLSATGLGSSGGMDTERRMAAETQGLNVGKFQGELMGRELEARRDEITHALDSMGNLLTEGERQQLQRELAAAENALKRHQIDTQNAQFGAQLSQADKQFYAKLAQDDKFGNSDNDFRWAQLGQSGDQFSDQMGFNKADRDAYWDAIRRGVITG